jgi:hypothetical protein
VQEIAFRVGWGSRSNRQPDSGPKFGPADEYAALRAELATSRGYIFERPLAIAALALAALAFDEARDTVAVAALLAALLTANLDFTVNRVENAARIVGYIRVVLEDDAPWKGWETSLEKYRECRESDPPIECGGGTTSLRSYGPSYRLHWLLMAACVTDGIYVERAHPSDVNQVALYALGLVFVVFAFFAISKWRPSRTSQFVPRSIATWRKVVNDLTEGH